MSTYYYFACRECREYGGFYSRQAWGWGNADLVASFAFLADHMGRCGHDAIYVLCGDDYASRAGLVHVVHPSQDAGPLDADEVLRPSRAFPRSGDWDRADELLAEARAVDAP